jgi:hypothetical protein
MHQLQLSVSMLKDHWKRFDALAVGESIGMISISQTPPWNAAGTTFAISPLSVLPYTPPAQRRDRAFDPASPCRPASKRKPPAGGLVF